MRRVRVVWLGLLACSLAGCLSDRPARSTSLIDRFRNIGGPTGPDAVVIEYALIERPLGDAAINRQIWKQIDEMVLPSETRALLCENGIRCGVVGGLLPSELEGMIQNPRSSVGHRERRLYVNNPAVIAVAGPVAQAEFQIRPSLDAKETTVKFEQARFALNFTPSHGPNGRITLKCVPELEFNDRKRWTPIGAVGEAWANQKPLERYSDLGFDVTLSPREFLVIGTDNSRSSWLGSHFFTDTVGHDKVQRLLIIQARYLASGSQAIRTLPQNGDVIPLASQAQITAARGNRP